MEIDGYARLRGIVDFLGIDASGDTEVWNFSGKSIAIVGKNGSGKTQILQEMAHSVFPWVTTPEKLAMNGNPTWSGGFLIKSSTSLSKSGVEGVHENILSRVALNGDSQDVYWGRIIPHSTELHDIYSDLEYASTQNGSDLFKSLLSPELCAYVTQEFELSNRFLLLPMQISQYRRGFDDGGVSTGLGIFRFADLTEDTPAIRQAIGVIYNWLIDVAQHQSLDETDVELIDLVSRHVEENGVFLDIFSGIFFPLVLGKEFLFRRSSALYEERFTHSKMNLPSFALEWPSALIEDKTSGDGPLCPIGVACDPILLGIQNSNLLQDAWQCVSKQVNYTIDEDPFEQTRLNLGVPCPEDFSTDRFRMRTLAEAMGPEISERTNEILQIWGVIPELFKPNLEDIGDVKGNPEPFLAELSIFAGSHIAYLGVSNSTVDRWVARAYQVAILEKSDFRANVVLWEEPEAGLHPSLVQRIADVVIPDLVQRGIKLVFSTHSLGLASVAEQRFEAKRLSARYPSLIEIRQLSSTLLKTLGFTSHDELLSIKQFVIVEGEHDRILLEEIFQTELQMTSTKILSMNGTFNLLTLVDAEILFKNLNAKVFVVLDGHLRSGLTKADIRDLNDSCAKGKMSSLRSQVSELKSAGTVRSEGSKILGLLHYISKTSFENGSTVAKRIQFFLLDKRDVIHYLNPADLFPGQSANLTWDQISSRWEKYGGIKRMPEKEYIRKILKLYFTQRDVKRAAKKISDLPLPQDLEELEMQLFGVRIKR